MKKLNVLKPGDKVAIVSPAASIANLFPDIYDLGLNRLRTIFNLDPIEMKHTKKLSPSFEEQAEDLHCAFSADDIKAVVACIGGASQIKLIKYLDKEIFKTNPKPFFGFSDNTNLLNFLWQNEVPGFYGGHLLNQFAMQGHMFPTTIDSLNWALFKHGNFEIPNAGFYNDEDLPWDNSCFLNVNRKTQKDSGPIFFSEKSFQGKLWGGCLESLDWIFKINDRSPTLDQLKKGVIFLETSEEIPSMEFIRRFIISLGENGILNVINGILVGRPKTWFFNNQKTIEEKLRYRQEQIKVINENISYYRRDLPVVQNLDFGHTDPQLILPYGGNVFVDSNLKKIIFSI